MATVKELQAQARELGYDGPFKGLLKVELEEIVAALVPGPGPAPDPDRVVVATADTVRVATPVTKTRVVAESVTGREHTRTASYAHVDDERLIEILGERGVPVPDNAERDELEGLMAASEPGVHVVRRSESY